MRPILIFAIGNPSRGDDAIGPEFIRRFAENIADSPLAERVELLEDFQLQIEHVTDLVGRERVVFVDAAVDIRAPYHLGELNTNGQIGYTTHAMEPESLLATYRQVYRQEPPPCALLQIRGESFELGSPLNGWVEESIDGAIKTLMERLKSYPM